MARDSDPQTAGSPAKPNEIRNTWDASQRQTLCLLDRLYVLSNTALTMVFNRVHKQELRTRGLPNGLSCAQISSQLWRLGRGMDRYIDHRDILEHPVTHIKQKYAIKTQEVERIMRAIGIPVEHKQLLGNAFAPITRTFKQYAKRERTVGLLNTPSSCGVESDDEEYERAFNDGRTKAASKSNKAVSLPYGKTINSGSTEDLWLQICNGKRTRLRHRREGNKPKRPIHLFRCWTKASGLEARLQLDKAPTDDMLRDYVQKHLSRSMTPSPFLSLDQRLKRVVYLAARANNAGDEAFISIIDYDTLRDGLELKYVDNVLHLVPALCQRFDLIFDRGYTGWGEFLAFQEIPSSAIISTFPADLLFTLKNDELSLSKVLQAQHLLIANAPRRTHAPKMDCRAGGVIGKLLEEAKVPLQQRELLAYRFAKEFKFKGAQEKRARVYVAYMAGVFGIDINVRESTPVVEDDTLQSEENTSEGDESDSEADIDKRFPVTSLGTALDYAELAVQAEDEQDILDHQLHATLAQFGLPNPHAASPIRLLPMLTPFSRELLAAAAHQSRSPRPYSYTAQREPGGFEVRSLAAAAEVQARSPRPYPHAAQQDPEEETDELRSLARSVSVLSVQPTARSALHEDDKLELELEMILEALSEDEDEAEDEDEVREVELIIID